MARYFDERSEKGEQRAISGRGQHRLARDDSNQEANGRARESSDDPLLITRLLVP